MTKTFNNLYHRIYDFENLHDAYTKARKGKRYKNEVLNFKMNLEGNLIELQNELIHKTFENGMYREFKIYEPKERVIMALPFKDRVVHHALCTIIEPIFENRFIYDSYACRPGKGTHAAADRTTDFLRKTNNKWDNVYCLKADVKKYFYNINHEILKKLLRKR
jgi:RNA-directed DNA polymerase